MHNHNIVIEASFMIILDNFCYINHILIFHIRHNSKSDHFGYYYYSLNYIMKISFRAYEVSLKLMYTVVNKSRGPQINRLNKSFEWRACCSSRFDIFEIINTQTVLINLATWCPSRLSILSLSLKRIVKEKNNNKQTSFRSYRL